MSFGFGVLRWTPEALWSATLSEMEGAASVFVVPEQQPMPLTGLTGLMARFPDEQRARDLDGV